MGTPKVDKAKLNELHDKGVTAAQIARQLGMSKGLRKNKFTISWQEFNSLSYFCTSPKAAISKALKAMGKAVNSHVAIEKAKKVVDRKMVTIEQIQKINDYANELLDLVMRWNRGEDVALLIPSVNSSEPPPHGDPRSSWLLAFFPSCSDRPSRRGVSTIFRGK